MILIVPLNYQQLQPLHQRCGDSYTITHDFYTAKKGITVSRTRHIDLIKMRKETLCFIKAVAIQRTYPAMVMSNSEYYQDYIAKFVGPNKEFRVNYMQKGKEVLLDTFNGLVLRRYEAFEEDVYRAVQTIQVYYICGIISQYCH